MRPAAPGDVERFTNRLAELVAHAVTEFDTPTGGGRYRVDGGGHPPAAASAAHPVKRNNDGEVEDHE